MAAYFRPVHVWSATAYPLLPELRPPEYGDGMAAGFGQNGPISHQEAAALDFRRKYTDAVADVS